MRKSQIVKSVATAAAAVGFVAGAAAPASAVASVGIAPSSCGVWSNQTCFGYAQDVPGVGSSGSDVFVACNATSSSTVQITVVQCYIEGNEGDIHYSPAGWTQGQNSTVTYTFPAWDLESRSYRVCIGAGFVDSWGWYHSPDGYTCGATI